MATASFDKRIVVNQKEAELLSRELKKKPIGPPEMSEEFIRNNEKEASEWLSRFEK